MEISYWKMEIGNRNWKMEIGYYFLISILHY